MAGKVKADELFDVKELNKRLDELVKKIVANDDALKALVSTMTKGNESLVAMSKNVKDFNDVKKRTVDVEKEAIKLQNQAVESNKKTLIAQEKYNQELEKTKRQVIQTEKAVNSLEKSKNRGAKATNNWTTALNSFQTKFNTIGNLVGGLALGAFGSLLGVLQKIISTNVEFDKSLKSLQSITGATSEEIKFYAQAANEMSQQSTQSASSILKAYEAVGSAVPILLKNKEALAEVTRQAIILSEASGGKMGVTDSAKALTAAMNQFNLSASKAGEVINVLAAGELAGSATTSELADSLKNVGAVANDSNLTLQQTTALLEVLAEKQLKGEEAGTKLRGSILKLQDAGLGYTSGTFNMKDALIEATEKLNQFGTDAEKDAYKLKIFGLENKTAGTILLDNIQKYDDLTIAVTGTTTALEQQMIQNESAAAQWSKLGNEIMNTFSGENISASMAGFVKGLRYTWLVLKEIVMGVVVVGNSIYDLFANMGVAMNKLIGKDAEWSNTTGAAMKLMADMWAEMDAKTKESLKLKDDIIIKTNEENKAVNKTIESKQKLIDLEQIYLNIENEKQKATIKQIEYYDKSIDNEIEGMQKALDAESEALEKSNNAYVDSVQLKAETDEKARQDKIKADEDDLKRAEEIRNIKIQYGIDVMAALTDISAGLNDRRIQEIEEEKNAELSALEEKYNRDIESAGNNEEKKKKLKEKYDKEKLKQEEKYNKEVSKIKKKQAILDKTANIIRAVADGLGMVLRWGKDLGVKGAIAAGVLSGLNIAAIAAQPIPEFATGVRGFEGGTADVGEKGREIIRTKEGQMFLTPNTRTRVNLPSGSDVFKNEETERMLKGGMSLDGMNKLISSNEKIEKSIANIKIMNTNISGSTVERIIQVGRVNTRLLNKYFA